MREHLVPRGELIREGLICGYISGLHITGPDPACFEDGNLENSSVTRFTQAGCCTYGFYHEIGLLVLYYDVKRDLWQKIDIQDSAAKLEMYSVLFSATLGKADSHTKHADTIQGFLNEGEPFFTDNCPYEFHSLLISRIPDSGLSSIFPGGTFFFGAGRPYPVMGSHFSELRLVVIPKNPGSVSFMGTVSPVY